MKLALPSLVLASVFLTQVSSAQIASVGFHRTPDETILNNCQFYAQSSEEQQNCANVIRNLYETTQLDSQSTDNIAHLQITDSNGQSFAGASVHFRCFVENRDFGPSTVDTLPDVFDLGLHLTAIEKSKGQAVVYSVYPDYFDQDNNSWWFLYADHWKTNNEDQKKITAGVTLSSDMNVSGLGYGDTAQLNASIKIDSIKTVVTYDDHRRPFRDFHYYLKLVNEQTSGEYKNIFHYKRTDFCIGTGAVY